VRRARCTYLRTERQRGPEVADECVNESEVGGEDALDRGLRASPRADRAPVEPMASAPVLEDEVATRRELAEELLSVATRTPLWWSVELA
jgi:hypothetical protein